MKGSAVIEITIGADGWVTYSRMISGTDFPLLNAYVLLEVGNWHFIPARRDDKPITVRKILQFSFDLE